MNFTEIAGIVLRASRAEQTEILCIEQNESLTRFANNFIHQNVTETNAQVTIRCVIGSKVGIAVSNDTRREALEQLAARACQVAGLQPTNPEFHGLPSPQTIEGRAAFDPAVEECSPETRARRAQVICRSAEAAGLAAAGSITTSVTTMGVANSLGILAVARSTLADATAVVMGSNSSGWAQRTGWRLDSLNTEAMAEEAVGKARMGANPVDLEAKDYPVILDPYATADVIEMLAFDGMSALAFQEERSWLNGRIGERIMAESVTIVDDGLADSGLPMPFDFEGVAKRRVAIVESGVARGPVYDSFTAGRAASRTSTGHATPPSPYGRTGPAPMNVFLGCGNSSVEEMIASTKLGLYITRFWYTRPVHPRDAVITGMTRDGTFLVKDGEIAYPVKSLRFTQSYVEGLRHTEAIGKDALVLRSGMAGVTAVPAVKLGKFRFTSSTK